MRWRRWRGLDPGFAPDESRAQHKAQRQPRAHGYAQRLADLEHEPSPHRYANRCADGNGHSGTHSNADYGSNAYADAGSNADADSESKRYTVRVDVDDRR